MKILTLCADNKLMIDNNVAVAWRGNDDLEYKLYCFAMGFVNKFSYICMYIYSYKVFFEIPF